MENKIDSSTKSPVSLAPWLSIREGVNAIEFYKSAFDAKETYRLDADDGGLIVRLAIGNAEFWIAGESAVSSDASPGPLGGGSIRMILMVSDPDGMFERVLKAGASQVYPISEDHGFRMGRLVDPFGLHWEIGRPL